MKTLFSAFVTFAIYTKVSSLKCYICDSYLHGRSCYDPINESNIKALDCKDVYSSLRNGDSSNSESGTFDFKQPEKLQAWNPNGNPNWYPNPNSNPYPTDFECVQYEKIYMKDNRREFVRRCQGRNQSPNFCGELQNLGNYQGYKLSKCDVCYGDYCNKSGSIKLSLLLNFAFFLIFYRCTDF